MASLNGQTPAATYEGLLKTNDNGTLPSGDDPAEVVTDGAGNASDLKLHNNHIEVRRLKTTANGFGNDTQYLGANVNGVLNWKSDGLVPSGGTTDQVLTKTATGYDWVDAGGVEITYGTWRPSLPFIGDGNTNNPSFAASYIKIGTWVYCTGKVNVNAFTADNTFTTSPHYFTNLPFGQDTSAPINKNFYYTSSWPPGSTTVFQGFHGGTNGTFTIVDSVGTYLADGFIVGFGANNWGYNTYFPRLVLNSTVDVSIPAGSAMMFQFGYKANS